MKASYAQINRTLPRGTHQYWGSALDVVAFRPPPCEKVHEHVRAMADNYTNS
ncbi:MAG TPA: hypothetical protein VLM89_15045 [Phycisphaerae bacterium]|nr:hypothetical protein [Phycisphaerae bacterium]